VEMPAGPPELDLDGALQGGNRVVRVEGVEVIRARSRGQAAEAQAEDLPRGSWRALGSREFPDREFGEPGDQMAALWLGSGPPLLTDTPRRGQRAAEIH